MKDILKAVIIVFSFSFLNGIIIYITTSIRYNAASKEEIAARYVNEPNFIESTVLSLVLVSLLYLFVKVHNYLTGRRNVWLMSFVVLLINMIVIYSFGSLVANVFTFEMFFNFLFIWGINFFIPFADRFVLNKLYKAKAETSKL